MRSKKPDRIPGRTTRSLLLAVPALLSCGGLSPAHAQSSLESVNVEAPREPVPATRVTEDIEASPASTTVIERRDLDRKTVTTYGDIFRGVAGFSVLEYRQGLVAYALSMRGFDSDHGRNVAVFLDGMPLNVTGSQHTNGYADLAQVIPELINRVEITRGPFSVLAGNHAVGGSVQLYKDASPASSVRFSVDQYGRARILPIYGGALGPGRLLLALDAAKGSAYAKQSDVERLNLFARYTLPVGDGLAAARLQLYEAEADAPGYLDRDRLVAGQIGLRDALSKGIGDAKSQQNLVFNYRSNDLEGTTIGGGWSASAWLNNDIRRRWTNFDLATPVGSAVPLNQERDHLQQLGFDVHKTQSFATAGLPSQALVGVQWNNEDIDGRRFQTDADRNPLAVSTATPDTISVDRKVKTRTSALYGQYQVQPIDALKLTAGLRYDRLQFDTTLNPTDDTFAAAQGAGSPTAASTTATQWSPKFGGALRVWENPGHRAEVFANVARGLKSPYAFSDLYGNIGVAPGVPDLSISSVRSRELGVQGGAKDGSVRWRASVWNTLQSREVDRNAAGVLQSFKRTDRDGFDLEGNLLLGGATRLFANYSRVRARIEDPVTPGADRIPNVPEYVATIGVLSVLPLAGGRADLSLADTVYGPQSVTTDNTNRTRSLHRFTARVAYTRPDWRGITVYLNAVAFNRRFDEYVVDFGGGQTGTIVTPRLTTTLGVIIPL